MSTGEKRTLSARRGMTVLGKIPAVPKPINLPSQRLENRGLDPNVEIVPRGGSGWGMTVRSPPVNNSCWGNSALSSSPPVGSWSTVVKQQGPSTSQAVVREWAKIPAQLSSAESNTRPSSAPASENRFCGATTKFEEQSYSSQFSLTHVDFPTLGSEKNPSLRPQHGAMFSNRPISADGKTLEKSRLLGHEVLGGRPTSAEGRVSDKEKISYHRGNRPTSADGNSTDKERHMIYSDISERTLNSPVEHGRYGHPIEYEGQPPLLRREMLQMDSHVVPLGLGTNSHHPVQYGYYRPPGVLEYTIIGEMDPSRGSMIASRMFPGPYPQLRPLIQLGQPGVCDYRPQQVPSEIYSGPDLAGGIQPSSPHSNYQIYDMETNFEGAHKYEMQQEDWRAAKDLGKKKNWNVDVFSVSGAESSSGRVKGTIPNGNERMGLTTEVGVLVRPGSFRLVGRGVALGQSQADLEASKLLGQSVNLSKESQSNYFQESVQSEEHRAKSNFQGSSIMKQEQLKEQPEIRNAVRIFTSHNSSNSTRVTELSNVKKVSGGLKNEIMVPASLLNNASVNIKESSVGSNSIGDVALNASPSSDITSACIQNDKNQLTSNMVPEGRTQDEQPMVGKQQFVTVSSEGSLGSVHEQGALGSPLRPGLNSSRDDASQHVECLGHDDTFNMNNFAKKEKTSVHANLMPKVLHTERKRTKSESHVEMPRMSRKHHDEHVIDKQINNSKVGIEPTSGKNPKCKKAVSLYPVDSNNMKNSSGATVPELSLVFGAVDAAITASLVGASKMNGLATTGSNSVANKTGKEVCKSSISKAEESGNAEWAKTLAITSPASQIGTTGEPINWECESLDANHEEAQVIINDNHSKAVEWKSNPSWHTRNRERSLHELPGMERSSTTTEGMKWTPVRAFSSNRKNDDFDAATVFGAPLSFSEGLKHSQQHQTARGGQQMLAMTNEQELGIEKLPLQPPTPASKADIKVERRKYKGGSGVYIPRHRRKEQPSSMDGLVETINQTAADEVNKQVTESQAAKHVRETNSQHHWAKQMNLIEKSDVEQEVRLPSNAIVHDDTEGTRVKKKNASLSQQDPVKLQNIVAKPQRGTRKSNRTEETPAEEEAKPRVETVFVCKSKNKHENKNHLVGNDRLQPEQQQDSPAGHEVWVQDGKPSHPEKKRNKDEVHRHGQHSVENDGHMDLQSSQEKKQEPCMLLEPTARYSDEDCPKPAMERRAKKCHHAPRQQKLQSPHSIEKLLEEESNEQRTMSTSENNMTKTKPHSSETTQRGQRQRQHKSILEIAAEKGVHVTDNPVVSVELKEGIKSEHYDNKEERKQQFGAKANTQRLMSNNPRSGKSSVREHWEPIQSMLAPVACVPEARKRKKDMKLHMRKPLSEQQEMQQQESAAYFHEVGIMPSKGWDSQEPMNTSDRKQHHESWMSKTDGVTDESNRNKQGGLMKNPPKDARGSVNTSYWRKQDMGHRQPIAGIGHGKQQMYVRKPTSMSEGDESVVHSSTVEAQTSKHSEHWLSEGEPGARLPGEGRHRSSVQHESRHGQFHGHHHQVVDRVSLKNI